MLVVEALLCFFASCLIYVKEMNLKRTIISKHKIILVRVGPVGFWRVIFHT